MEERHLNEIRIFLNALIEMVKFLFLGNMELGWEQSRWICTATERTITRTFRWISFMLENFLLKKECEKCYSYLPIWGQWLYLWFVSMNSRSLFWLHSNFLFIILFFFNYYLKVFFFLYCLHGQSNFALSNLRQIFVVSKMIQIICTRCESGLPFAVLQNVAYVNKQNSSVYHQ